MSVSQVLTTAGGLQLTAEPTKAVVLRPILNSTKRAEIPLNLTRIMAGKDIDFPLLPNDLLYVPPKGGFTGFMTKGGLVILPLALTLTVLLIRFL
jgi:hypothetical protein